jgi:hypothetical protein
LIARTNQKAKCEQSNLRTVGEQKSEDKQRHRENEHQSSCFFKPSSGIIVQSWTTNKKATD